MSALFPFVNVELNNMLQALCFLGKSCRHFQARPEGPYKASNIECFFTSTLKSRFAVSYFSVEISIRTILQALLSFIGARWDETTPCLFCSFLRDCVFRFSLGRCCFSQLEKTSLNTNYLFESE